ncbi:MAG TPA: hypothetical protein VEB68_00400 [Croceibacterium sp.]|nr:hypothetical protein [Croceibacterium sp.]
MPRLTLPALLSLLIAGCAAAPTPEPQPGAPPVAAPRAQPTVPPTLPTPRLATGFRTPTVLRVPGLEGVIESDAASLVRSFGNPRLDVSEGDMRKLQFTGEACVLDVFLYPLRDGGEPVATYLEARRARDGQEVDRVACVQALQRR